MQATDSGGSVQIIYFSKNTNATMGKYSLASKSPAFKVLLYSKKVNVLSAKYKKMYTIKLSYIFLGRISNLHNCTGQANVE